MPVGFSDRIASPAGFSLPGGGDDPDPAVQAAAQHPLQLGEERPGLARGLIPGLGASGSLTGTVSSAVVDLAAVPECHDNDEQHVVGHRVDDAVVANPDA